MRAILPALLLLAATAFAGELCVEDGLGLCCNPCDVPELFGGTGYSMDGDPGACPHQGGGLTISASDTDPFVNEGPLAPLAPLYVWLLAGAPGGYGFDWGYATIDGDLEVLGYQPYPVDGYSSWNPVTKEFYVSLDCGFGTHLLGEFEVLSPPTGAESSTGVESWARVKARWRETADSE